MAKASKSAALEELFEEIEADLEANPPTRRRLARRGNPWIPTADVELVADGKVVWRGTLAEFIDRQQLSDDTVAELVRIHRDPRIKGVHFTGRDPDAPRYTLRRVNAGGRHGNPRSADARRLARGDHR